MKAFVSWSGGKDCMLALYRVIQSGKFDVKYLVNMCDQDTDLSRSHGLRKELIVAQSAKMNIELIQQPTLATEYEINFKSVLSKLKNEGIEYGIFGDIYLEAHKVWIDRVCSEMDIQPIFPLWLNDTKELLQEFINLGFVTKVVSVRKQALDETWLGRILDQQFIGDISKLEGVDACAENGEYHSFVFDGPLFKNPVEFKESSMFFKDDHWFLPLNLMNS